MAFNSAGRERYSRRQSNSLYELERKRKNEEINILNDAGFVGLVYAFGSC